MRSLQSGPLRTTAWPSFCCAPCFLVRQGINKLSCKLLHHSPSCPYHLSSPHGGPHPRHKHPRSSLMLLLSQQQENGGHKGASLRHSNSKSCLSLPYMNTRSHSSRVLRQREPVAESSHRQPARSLRSVRTPHNRISSREIGTPALTSQPSSDRNKSDSSAAL